MPRQSTCSDREELLEVALARRSVDGLVLEFGVYRGGSLDFLAERIEPDRVFGFDSFEGLPADWRPGFGRGAFATKVPTVRWNAELIVGRFEDTLPRFLERFRTAFSFIHIDCDLYSSTCTIFEQCHDRIVPGTVIVFDEYQNYPGWEDHEHRAFLEFVSRYRRSFDYIACVPGGEQVALVMRT